MIRISAFVGALVALPTIVAAGGTGADPTSARTEQTGTLSGTIRFSGEAPDPATLSVNVDAEVCAVQPILDESLLVDTATSGVKNVVVWLEGVPSAENPAGFGEIPTLDQKGCRYEPHVLVVRSGQEIHILNSDGILHNTHTRSTSNRPINKAQPGFLKTVAVSFRQPEIVEVGCDAHEWMSAWIVVAEHSFYTVTDQTGGFRFEGVPPGTYTLQVWHESLGRQSARVTVVGSEQSQVDLEFSSLSSES